MKTLLFTFTFFVTTTVYGQQLSEGWSNVAVGESGSVFSYHSHSIIKDAWPPTTVSVKIASTKDGKSKGFQQWEFRCPQQEVKIDNGNFISVASDANSIRKTLLIGFCGINQADGQWFLVGALLDKNSGLLTYLFLDANSISRVDKPVPNGVAFKYSTGRLELTRPPYWNPVGPITLVMDCNNSGRFFASDTTKSQGFEEMTAVLNTVPRAMNHLVCSGYYPIVISNNQNSPAINIDSAKSKCQELGFKQGTEPFGKCVLQLSK